MHNIHWIRENPDVFDAAMLARGSKGISKQLLGLDERRKEIQTKLQQLQERRNISSKLIGNALSDKNLDKAELLKSEVVGIKNKIQLLESKERVVLEDIHNLLSASPNLPAHDVPVGLDESANVEVRKWGHINDFEFKPKQHFDIGVDLELMDFDMASNISGSRFVVLFGSLARLERALGNFMLDIHINEYGYTEVSPPLLVNEKTAYGTGNLPKFTEDLFKSDRGHILIPTAEMPLTNLVNSKVIDSLSKPLRYVAYTPCFRAEAGAAGKDTRGMIRQHQFNKVELVSITNPEDSANEHERMTNCAEFILQSLELPYRVVTLSTGDMGFSAKKTYDLEVWLPGQQAYREISSCSNCGDFQARRMNARFRENGKKGINFVHTLNGSGVAVGRALVAIIENYQLSNGSIKVPEKLVSYMGGQELIK